MSVDMVIQILELSPIYWRLSESQRLEAALYYRKAYEDQQSGKDKK